jgi:hypothetical protein
MVSLRQKLPQKITVTSKVVKVTRLSIMRLFSDQKTSKKIKERGITHNLILIFSNYCTALSKYWIHFHNQI